MRRPYKAIDAIVEGDYVVLGRHPRKVLTVTRDDVDRVRFITVPRLHGMGTVALYHSDMGPHSETYEFKGWLKRATEAPR